MNARSDIGATFVLWLTGLSGAGKTTLARLTADSLRGRGMRIEVLDGDEIRRRLSPELGFSRKDRDRNVVRLAFLSELLARNGVSVIVAAISPYWEERALARAVVGAHRFIETHVDCPLPVCIERDVKGLYRRALAGDLPRFTGVGDPYQAPESPELVVRTDREAPEASVDRILDYLESGGWAPRAGGPAVRALDLKVGT